MQVLRKIGSTAGSDKRDSLWDHPDLVPSAEDILIGGADVVIPLRADQRFALASALAQKKRFPGLLAMFARLGEQTGKLPLMLQRAAHQLGLSPEVVHAGPGVMVSRFIELTNGRTGSGQRVVKNRGKILTTVPEPRFCSSSS